MITWSETAMEYVQCERALNDAEAFVNCKTTNPHKNIAALEHLQRVASCSLQRDDGALSSFARSRERLSSVS